MAYRPQVLNIAAGGTNAATMATSGGIVKYDGTSLVTSSTAKIDSSNRYTNTSQPAFLAYVTNVQSNVTGDGTIYTVVYDTESFDNGANFDPATGIFTAPVTGYYQFNCLVSYNIDTATPSAGAVILSTTSQDYSISRIGSATDVSTVTSRTGSIIVPLTATNTARLQLRLDGSTKAVDIIAASSGRPNTHFSGFLFC